MYLVACWQEDVFPPLSLLQQGTLPFRKRLCTHDVGQILIEWPVQGTEADFEEVVRCIAGHKERVKTAHISQPFPGDREASVRFFRLVLTQLRDVNVKLVIRRAEDSDLIMDLALLKRELADRKFSVVTVKDSKLCVVITPPLPPVPAQPADLNLSHSSGGQPLGFEEHKAMQPGYRSSHSSELPDLARSLPVRPPRDPFPAEESKIPVPAVSPIPNPPYVSLPVQKSPSPSLPDPSKPETHGLIDFHEEDYRCIICLSIFRDPYITACCNTIICQRCSPFLGSKCPQCRRQPFQLTTNKALNRIFEGIKEKCACGAEVSGRDFEEHKKICQNRTFKCPCGSSFRKVELIDHLKTTHREIILSRLNRLKIA